MEKIPHLLLVAMLGYGTFPHMTEFELSAGPHWADVTLAEPLLRSMVGGAGTVPVGDRHGFRYGVGYRLGGGPQTCISAPCLSGDSPYSQELWDFIDVSILGTRRVPLVDRLELRVALGASVGTLVGCRVKNLSTGATQECDDGSGIDARFLAGAGLGYRLNGRFGLGLHSWYGYDLVSRPGTSLSLVAGVTYRRGTPAGS